MSTDPLLDSALAEAGWLRELARSLVKDPHRAEDAVQETLAKALAKEPPRGSPRAWLAAVLRNGVRQEARALARRTFHEKRAERPGSAPSAHDVNERLELQRMLLEAVRALEEPYRAAIVARFFDGLPPRAIARRDGVPVRTVNTRLERGLAKLRERLDARFGGDRGAWLHAFLPLAGAPAGVPWGFVNEGMSVGAKTKLAGALVAAGIGVLWLREVVSRPESRATSAESAQRAPAPNEAELGASALASAELVPAEVPARETRTASAGTAPAPAPTHGSAAEARARARLGVRVVKRRSGAPLSGAAILVTEQSPRHSRDMALFEHRGEALASGDTDAAGGARFDVPAGMPLWVSVDPGRRHARQGEPEPETDELLQRTTVEVDRLASAEERSLVIEIEHGSDRVLEGQVVAAEGGRPIAGARVDPGRSFGAPIQSDEGGFFALPYSSWDPPTAVEIGRAGFTPVTLRPRWVDQAPGLPIVVPLERDALVVARVDDAAGRELTLRARAERGSGDPLFPSTRLDASGRGELAVPARLPLALEVFTREGELLWRESEPWMLAPGERRELVLSLAGGTLVFGSLLDDARQPIEGREILAVPAEGEEAEGELRYLESDPGALVARTGRDGRFELPPLAPGSWWIGPAPRGEGEESEEEALAPAGVRVELAPGTPSRRLDLIGHRGLWIRGVVVGEDGRALAEIEVGCGREQNASELQALSDHAGRFRLGPLFPGTYLLRTLGGDGVFGWSNEPTRAEAGATDVVLVLPAKNSIGGFVVDREGRAVDAQVHLLRRNSSLGQGTSQREQGAFLFLFLEPGSYTVQAEAPDGRVAVRSLSFADGARARGLLLTLQEGTRIGVRHDLARGVRCAIWAGDALAADSTVSPGEESFETVPAGPLRVELYSGDEVFAVRELVGRAGRVESVEFDLEAGR